MEEYAEETKENVEILSKTDVAIKFKLKRNTVDNLFKDPKLKKRKIGKRVFTTTQAVNQYFLEN